MIFLFCGIVSFLSGILGAGLIVKFGNQFNLLDISNTRSSHAGSIPKGGGVGILVAFLIVSLYLGMPIFLILPALVISLISFIGDRYELSVILRLFAQAICALTVVLGIYNTQETGSVFLIVAMVLFIVGSSNIYNFMDGINGIAGMTAVVAFGFLVFYQFMLNVFPMYQILCFSLAISAFGFLFFNLPIARVFMGDVGSILIGFVFSSLVLLTAQNMLDFFCMAGFLLPFYLDEMVTIVVRIKNNESLFLAHRKHIYQLLVNELGFLHWKVSFAYAVVQFVICALIIILRPIGLVAIIPALIICGGAYTCFSILVYKKVKESK